jgi:hypothetical protein
VVECRSRVEAGLLARATGAYAGGFPDAVDGRGPTVTDTSHFPVWSEVRNGESPSLAGTEPGRTVLRDEIAERDSARGTPIGVVHVILTRSKAKPVDVVARVVFNFDTGDTLAAMGALPFHEEEDFDAGTLAITGGTGEYEGRRGVLTVVREGPHRWFVNGGP